MKRLKNLIGATALAAALPAVIAGCGGGSSDEDPQEVLQQTFSNDQTISSGVLDLKFDLSAEGDQGGSITAAVSGPFQSDPDNPKALPQADLSVSASGEGSAAEAFEDVGAGILITEDNLYVNYQDTDYELGEEAFTQLEEQAASGAGDAEGEDGTASFREACSQAIEAQGGDPAACDFDVTAWFGELSNDGTEDKGGAETVHISGQLNLETMISDLFQLGASVPGATGGVDPALIEPQLEMLSSAVSDAGFDVYSATEDDTLRGLDFNLAIDPSAIPGGESAGVDSASIDVSFEVSDVGSEQSFEAPEDAQPIEDLGGQFGDSLGSIPGVGAGGSSGGSGAGGSSGGADPAGGTGIDPDCLDQAGADPDAIQACLE